MEDETRAIHQLAGFLAGVTPEAENLVLRMGLTSGQLGSVSRALQYPTGEEQLDRFMDIMHLTESLPPRLPDGEQPE
jgi:hypothetical protein